MLVSSFVFARKLVTGIDTSVCPYRNHPSVSTAYRDILSRYSPSAHSTGLIRKLSVSAETGLQTAICQVTYSLFFLWYSETRSSMASKYSERFRVYSPPVRHPSGSLCSSDYTQLRSTQLLHQQRCRHHTFEIFPVYIGLHLDSEAVFHAKLNCAKSIRLSSCPVSQPVMMACAVKGNLNQGIAVYVLKSVKEPP